MEHYELTGDIIKAAVKVHKAIGAGYKESVYQKALAISLQEHNIAFDREKEYPIFYRKEKVGYYKADFLIQDKVIVELKAVFTIEMLHVAQTINYLKVANKPIGLILNFGQSPLEVKRVHNRAFIP